MNQSTFLYLSPAQWLVVVILAFVALVFHYATQSTASTVDDDPGELQYEMDNVDREALRISREMMKLTSEEDMWKILGSIARFELLYHENPNAYDYGKALRAQWDDKRDELFAEKKAVA